MGTVEGGDLKWWSHISLVWKFRSQIVTPQFKISAYERLNLEAICRSLIGRLKCQPAEVVMSKKMSN